MVRKGRWVEPPRARGEKVKNSKLGREEVREIRRRCASGETQTAVAAAFGVRDTCVQKIVSRESWAWL
jgi:DNA invertase Pin-like site-specific DNA recombinase